MSGMRWPHRATPRQVQSIADDEVLLWEMRQHEQQDPGSPDLRRRPANDARESVRDKQQDRLGFHYWSDAIVAELTRVMVAKADDDASPGFVEDPMSFVEHRTDKPASKDKATEEHRHWFHRGSPGRRRS